MECFTNSQLETWAERVGIEFPASGAVCFKPTTFRVMTDCPASVRAQKAMLREIFGFYSPQTNFITQLRTWNEFSLDGGILEFFLALRQQHGERRPLQDAPVHEFPHTERELCLGFLDLALACDWEVVWMPKSEPFLVWAHMDGKLIFICRDRDAFGTVTATMAASKTKFEVF